MRKKVSCVSVWAPTLDGWLTKLEKKAFGWYHWSSYEEDEKSLEVETSGTVREKHKYRRWMDFRRPSPYTHNLLFKFAEFLENIFSFLRRLFVAYGFLAVIIVIIFAAIIPELTHELSTVAIGLLSLYSILLFGTIIFSLLGVALRKAFHIDDKLREILGDDLEDACFTSND